MTVNYRKFNLPATAGMLIALVTLSNVSRADDSPFCRLPPADASPWLPNTPLPSESAVPTPRAGPGDSSDCQFYRPAWQRFLVATQPKGDRPTFLDYPSFDSLFSTGQARMFQNHVALMLEPRTVQHPNVTNATIQQLIDTAQAGVGGVAGGALVDQNGHFVYYAIHVNPDFADFVRTRSLTSVAAIQGADPQLTFLGSLADAAKPQKTNIVEYKSAWMIVDKSSPPNNYFVVDALIPHLVVQNSALVQSNDANGQPAYDPVKVALIALHVVFTLPGHPEMIWSTFEHVHLEDGEAVRDNAPAAPDNPSKVATDQPIDTKGFSFPLYKTGTKLQDANKPITPPADIVRFWNSSQQAVITPDGSFRQTSVYRPYPGSKPDGSKQNPDHSEDSEITLINRNATAMFTDAQASKVISESDKRQFYRLVGATWLDQPLGGSAPTFTVGASFTMGGDASTDDPGQAIAGEGRLGSTAMESFTEFENGAPSCFSCHDTNKVTDNRLLVKAKLLNVSHVFSRFVDLNLPAQN
jgi:hypothetical protein